MIQEPPGGAKLDFPGNGSILKVPSHGGKQIIIGRIQIVKNRTGKSIFPVEPIQENSEQFSLRPITDRIQSDVGALEHARVGIAMCTQVELFSPALFRIKMPKEEHHERRELRMFLRAGRLPG